MGGLISRPYLPVIDAPALRFREPVPPPDLSVLSAASGPPVEASEPETVVASPTVNAPDPPAEMPAADALPPATAPPKEAKTKAEETPKKSGPLSIIPDDTRPRVRTEDFLPFFTFPGSGRSPDDVTVIHPGVPAPPAPGTVQPSTATYQQR